MTKISIFKLKDTPLEAPFISDLLSCGFPNPASDFMQEVIDLNDILIKNKNATYFAKVEGDSMIDVGIEDGDLIIIDRLLPIKNGTIAVCYIDGQFTIKRVKREGKRLFLTPENPSFEPIEINEFNDFRLFGALSFTIKDIYAK
jgi:DNA polymerase V